MRYLSLCFIFFLTSCIERPTDSVSLLVEINEKYDLANSISFELKFHEKRFSSELDTSLVSAKIHQIRNNDDANFKCDIWLEIDSIIYVYLDSESYKIDHVNHKVTSYEETDVLQIWNSRNRDLVQIYFIDSKRLLEATKDSIFTSRYSRDDTGHSVHLENSEIEGIENQQLSLHFNNRKQIANIIFKDKHQNKTQYKSWDIWNTKLNEIEQINLMTRLNQYLKEYENVKYEAIHKTNKKEQILSELAPMQATSYDTGDTVLLFNVGKTLKVVDFWYQDCPPCIKAIPYLNSIHNKYKTHGIEVFGINPIDNNEKGIKRLPNFFEHNQVDYPVFLTERDEVKNLGIEGYPTIFLLDSENNILFTETGFSQEQMLKLDSVINSYINI